MDVRGSMRERVLFQDVAAGEIANRFGEEFLYENHAGNLAISRQVLAEFRKLTETSVVWDRGEKAWRLRESFDGPGRQSE